MSARKISEASVPAPLPAPPLEGKPEPTGAPRVAVVMAARDASAFLPETLASLGRQTLPGFSFVAVDDGSRDATGAILRRHADQATGRRPVRVLRTEGVGLAAARNRALAEVDAELICFLDGDDVLAPMLLKRARDVLAARPEVDLAYPVFEHVNARGAPLGVFSRPPKGPLTPAGLLTDNPIHSDSGVVVRRSAAEAAGPFDAALTGCIGLDYWYRVLALRPANAACLDERLVAYRRSGGQITADPERMERNFRRVLAKAEGGDGLTSAARDRVLSAQGLYWASIAYARGDYAKARAYTLGAWRAAPLRMARHPYAYARAAICVVSALPHPLHAGLRRAARRGLVTRRRSRFAP